MTSLDQYSLNADAVMRAAPTRMPDVLEAAAAGRVRRTNPLRIASRIFQNLPIAAWIAFDTIILWAAAFVGYTWFGVHEYEQHVAGWQAGMVFAGAIGVCSLVFGLHERDTLRSTGRILTRLLLTTILGTLLVYAIIYVLMYMELSRRVVAVTIGGYFAIGASVRIVTSHTIASVKRRMLIVGSPSACAAFASQLQQQQDVAHGLDIAGYASENAGCASDSGGPRCLGDTRHIVRICRDHGIDDIVICNGMAQNPSIMDWILPCLRLGARVTNEATFYENVTGQILVQEITPEWFLFADLKSHCDEYASLKRVVDVLVSVVGLIVSLPLYPIVALAIRIEDGGPVLYSQQRVGLNGRIFKLYKFRTMRIDAENGKPIWARRSDPRVTRVGRILRRTRFDEFPQFVNILLGHMSVVGPRPERPDFVMELCRHIPYWSERNLVKPGLTGWAQISFRYGNTIDDARRKLQYDLYYLKHMNLELDIIILFRTLGTFLRGAC